MPADQRSTYPLCGARKRDGSTCRAFAGTGTDHKGYGPCKYHLGATANHRQAAAVAEAQQQMAALGGPIDVEPQEALRGVLRLTAGHVAHLAARAGQLQDLGSPESRAVLRMYAEERDRLARVGKACLDAGFTAAEIELGERHTALVQKLLEAVIGELDLTPEQRRGLGPAIRRQVALMLPTGQATRA